LEQPCLPGKEKSPIGVFDSGVGGLTVLNAIWDELPDESIIYLADQVHVPYGQRPLEEVRRFSENITIFLLEKGVKLVVVACNTASAAALHWLRYRFPDMSFVGMEPAIKPAAEGTQTGVVGVLATPATFQGELYTSVVERFAGGVRILQHTCPGLVNHIENGDLESRQTRQILEDAIQPMLCEGIDTIVLGCTHYPFVIPLIKKIAGPKVRVINPAPAIARQVRRVLEGRHCLAGPLPLHSKQARTQFFTTGALDEFQALIPHLLSLTPSLTVEFVEL
jgi:glutamate racemase